MIGACKSFLLGYGFAAIFLALSGGGRHEEIQRKDFDLLLLPDPGSFGIAVKVHRRCDEIKARIFYHGEMHGTDTRGGEMSMKLLRSQVFIEPAAREVFVGLGNVPADADKIAWIEVTLLNDAGPAERVQVEAGSEAGK